MGLLSWGVPLTACWRQLVQHGCSRSHVEKIVCSLLRTVPIMFYFSLFLLFFSGNGSVGLTYCKSVSLFGIYPSLFVSLEILSNYESVKEISLETGNYVNHSVAAVSQTMSCD